MRLRTLIADDEPLARARLRRLLAECSDPAASVEGEAANARQALELLRRKSFDLALLDIRMPGMDGMELARTVSALAAPPRVVFVTAHPEYALSAFEVGVADYLTKPVRQQRLQEALRRVVGAQAVGASTSDQEDLHIHQADGGLRLVPLAEVQYARADDKSVRVGTLQGEHQMSGSLTQLELMHPEAFLRVHRNTLVAPAFIQALKRTAAGQWVVQLRGVAESFPVSRRQLPQVRARLHPPGRP